MPLNILKVIVGLYLYKMRLRLILFLITLSLSDLALSQDNSFTETYSYFRKYDKNGNKIHDWILQNNTFIYNVNGTTDLIWINENGVGDTLIVSGESLIDYTDYGEEYEYRKVYSLAGWEEFYIIRFSDYEILRISFDDGEMWEFGN